MSDPTTSEVLNLTQIYARYFVEDTAYSITNHLSASYPVDQTELKAFIDQQTDAVFNNTTLGIHDVNVCTRFLYECAQHALREGTSEPEQRSVWDQVKALPSIHHPELGAMVFSQANQYKQTIDKTLLGVVARDAHTASQAIVNAAQERSEYRETGGTLQTFGWGILGDGLWLNGAMLKAFDLASVFRAGEPVSPHYVDTSFSFAHQYATLAILGREDEALANGTLSIMLANPSDPSVGTMVQEFGQTELSDMLFAPGMLDRYVTAWESATKNPNQIVSTVQQLSLAARILSVLIDTARQDRDDVISATVKDRIHAVNDVVTLALVGYEALRETRFGEALILSVTGEGEDPKVDVVVNNDMMNSFRSAGGEESDLVQFGLYLDPRRGTVGTSNTGWSLDHILARRDTVVPQMMAEDQDRLERLRNNDSAAVIVSTQQILNTLVRSYLNACQRDTVDSQTYQQIAHVIREVVNPESEQQLDQAIADVLLRVMDDPFLTHAFETFRTCVKSDASANKDNAKALTVAKLAIDDLVDFISHNPE